MERLLNWMTAMSVILMLLVLFSTRRARIRVEYSVSWLIAALVILVLSRSRSLLESIASQLGITYPPLALVMIVGGIFLIVFFRVSVVISKLKDDNIALAQRLAILEYHLRKIQDRPRNSGH